MGSLEQLVLENRGVPGRGNASTNQENTQAGVSSHEGAADVATCGPARTPREDTDLSPAFLELLAAVEAYRRARARHQEGTW